MISGALPVQCRLGPGRLCYPRSGVNAMTISNQWKALKAKQSTRLRDVAWSQKPHACRDAKPALMQADQRQRALIVGDRGEIFSLLFAAGGLLPSAARRTGARASRRDPSKARPLRILPLGHCAAPVQLAAPICATACAVAQQSLEAPPQRVGSGG